MRKNRSLPMITIGLFIPFILSAQWESDVRLTDNTFDSRTSFNNAWCVVPVGSYVHVVWHDNRDGNTEIYHKRSTDSGTTWEADTRLTIESSGSECPSIAVRDSIIHLAWYDSRLGPPRLFYKRSLDNGTSWGPDVSLTPTAGVVYQPSVAVTDSIVHIVWTDMRAGPQIYYTRSIDNGTTWEVDRIITPSAPAAGKNLASVAVSDSIVHVTWMDMRANPQIYYTRSLDNGTTWEADRSITPAPSQFASVAVSDSIVHVVYADFRLGASFPKIYYTQSLDNGMTWEPEIMLADSFASWYPSVAVSGCNVHAVWPDSRHGDPSEIYYKSSIDNGMSWGMDTRLTDNPSESREPSVAVCDSIVHVVWYDDRDGNWEIYYKRNPNGNIGIREQEYILSSDLHSFFVPTFFNDKLTMRFNCLLQGPLEITLYDICGAAVFSAHYNSVPSLLNIRDTGILNLTPGIYFLHLDLNNHTETRKLIKLN